MEEFVAKYRPFRERTVRKDKVGAWPTAVYTKQQDSTEWTELFHSKIEKKEFLLY